MFRYWVGAILGALLAVAFAAILWRPAAPVAPPESVVVNFQPYPEAKAVTPHPSAPQKAPVVKPTPAAPAPAAEGPIHSVKKPGKTWKRVYIIDGRKCYQPMGGGDITARYCE